MSGPQNKFDLAIWKVVSSIQPGRVMSYGEVARLAGYPKHARMVSKSMGRSKEPLPWHRVVKSNRTLAFEPGGEMYQKQQALLESEAVFIVDGTVIPVDSDDDKDLDELLWGPPG